MNQQAFFRDVWPESSRRVARRLAARGIPPGDIDDVLQEAAIRLLKHWDALDQRGGLDAFVYRIAVNVWLDEHRRRRPLAAGDALPDRISADPGPEDVALLRAEVRQVGRALRALDAGRAEVLRSVAVTELDSTTRRRQTAADRMARTRARRSLVAMCARLGTLAAALLAWIRATRRRVAGAAAIGVTVALVAAGVAAVAHRAIPLPVMARSGSAVSATPGHGAAQPTGHRKSAQPSAGRQTQARWRFDGSAQARAEGFRWIDPRYAEFLGGSGRRSRGGRSFCQYGVAPPAVLIDGSGLPGCIQLPWPTSGSSRPAS